jgi:diguanylate cyclase (GGDEF)-like protein
MAYDHPFYLLIPAVFGLFAVALGLIAVFERRLLSARWAALGFMLGSISLVIDGVRTLGQLDWPLWFAAMSHFAAMLALIAGFLARSNQRVPAATVAITLAGAILLMPYVPWQQPLGVRSAAMQAVGAGMIFSALSSIGPQHRVTQIDKVVFFVTFCAGLTYLIRMVLATINLVLHPGSALAEVFGPMLMVFHITGAITGMIVGLVLMLSIGHDMLRLKIDESETDPLTGLGNRRRLDRLIADDDDNGQIGAVIMIDLDRFKSINDRYGHDAGDEVLRKVGARLAGVLGPLGAVCRIGGEEFVALLGQPSAKATGSLAIAARAAIAGLSFDGPASGVRTTASVGFCLVAPDIGLREALKRADQAVYAAKADGRDRVVGSIATKGLQVLKAVA